MKVKLVATDIDGVWTDGGMYYDQQENELKKFNTSDSAGILFLKELNIPVAILTGENTKIVKLRSEKLHVDHIFQGIKNKKATLSLLCTKLNLPLSEVAYIGDDLTDVPLLKAVGFSAVPANTPSYVQMHAKWILKRNGGEGVFREFVEKILSEMGLLEYVVAKIIDKISDGTY